LRECSQRTLLGNEGGRRGERKLWSKDVVLAGFQL